MPPSIVQKSGSAMEDVKDMTPLSSQHSLMMAQEAQLELQSALRLEREQREKQQQQAMQRERFHIKQEPETASVHQFEPFAVFSTRPGAYSAPPPPPPPPPPPLEPAPLAAMKQETIRKT